MATGKDRQKARVRKLIEVDPQVYMRLKTYLDLHDTDIKEWFDTVMRQTIKGDIYF